MLKIMPTEVGKTEVVAHSVSCLFTAHSVTAACREPKSACKHKSAALISSRSSQAGARITFRACSFPVCTEAKPKSNKPEQYG